MSGRIVPAMPPRPGLTAKAEIEVEDSNTALAIGSGDVPVLSTPHVVALCEQAAQAGAGIVGGDCHPIGCGDIARLPRQMVARVQETLAVDLMMQAGLLKEAQRLGKRYGWGHSVVTSIGHRQLGQFLRWTWGFNVLLKPVSE